MFHWFLKQAPALCLVAMEEEEIIGYVVGAFGGYGRQLFRDTLFEVILGYFLHPILWTNRITYLAWRSYLRGLRPQKRSNINPIVKTQTPVPFSAALADIGVSMRYQGRGVGKALAQEFENASRQAGAVVITLSVHENNISAQKVYESCGWLMDGSDPVAHTVHYSKRLSRS